VIGEIVYVFQQWFEIVGCIAKGYGSHKTLYNRFVRWSRVGEFAKILQELIKGDSNILIHHCLQIILPPMGWPLLETKDRAWKQWETVFLLLLGTKLF
jgi:hypothetical protein